MKLIACAALAVLTGFAGAAGAGVNKCVDQEGRVLFTDADCPPAETKADVEIAPSVTEAKPPVLPPVLAPAPRSRWAALPRPMVRKAASIDTATLQAARQSMQLQDQLHQPRRLLSAR